MSEPGVRYRCVEVRRPESHGDNFKCVYRLDAFSAMDEFDGAEPGETITLTLAEMSQEDFDALPDFEGW